MAGLRKDVELIFRGEDRASPTIKKVRQNVNDLGDAIQQQVAAAERGEGSIEELAKAHRQLGESMVDVREIAKIASAYDSLTRKLDEQAAKTEEARQKEAKLTAEIAAAEKPTKRLQNARDAAARSLQANAAKEEAMRREVAELGAALDAAGGDSKSFAATQDAVRQAAVETARALRDATAAMDEFKAKQNQAAANKAAAADADKFNAMAAGSGLPKEQIAFISQLENRMQALTAAIREQKAAQDALNAAQADRAAALAATDAALLKQRLDEAAQAALRLEAAAKFRNIAAEIEAGARDIQRFGTATDSTAVSVQRLGDAVQAILNPTQAAASNLQSVNSILDQAESSLEGNKRRLSEYNAELNNLQAASAGLTGIAGSIDNFRRQEAAVNAARSEMEIARGEVLKLSGAIQTADAPTKEMVADLQRAEAGFERAGAAMQKEVNKLAELERGLESAGVDVRNLDKAQETLIASSNRLAAAQAKITNATKGKGSFLGLNPNEMTNLGYQINDIVVSLASGQNPLMVFAQQGAQIGQIIPGAFSAIASKIPQLAALAAVVLTVAGAMKKADDEARRLAQGVSIVGQVGDGGTGVSAQGFADLAAQMENAGVKAEDVREKLVQLSADGLNTAQMEQYIETAKTAAEATGVDFADALETVRGSFQGGMEDIIALDDAQNIYNDTQLDTIQSLFDQGKADEARTMALTIYQQKMNDVAAQQQGGWKTATDQLSQAWSNFLGWLSNTAPITYVRQKLAELATGAAFVATLLNQIASGKGIDIDAAGKTAMGITMPKAAKGAAADPGRTTNAGRRMLAEDREALAIAKARTPAEKAAAQAIANRRKYAQEAANAGLSSAEAQRHVEARLAADRATFDGQQAKRDARAGKSAASKQAAAERRRAAAARAAANRAKAEQNRIENQEEGLQRQIESLDASVARKSTQGLDERLTAIDSKFAKLFRGIDEYAAATGGKGKIGGRTIGEARAHIETQKQELRNFETLSYYEQQIGELEQQRDERLKSIADNVRLGIIKPEDGLTQSNAVISDMAGQINAMAAAGLAFAEGIKGAKPDPQLLALIEKFRTAGSTNANGNVSQRQDNSQALIEGQMRDLNDLIQHRTALIEHENALVDAGLQTRNDAERKIAGHYATTSGLIQQQINQIRALRAAYGSNLTPEMQRYFDQLEINLQQAALETQYVDSRFQEMKNGFNQVISSGIVGFIDQVAQSFANLATQQTGVLGFLGEIGRAFLGMIAQMLQGIAMLIIQALVLDAVDKLTGGLVKPLLKLYTGSGVFHEGGVAGNNGSSSRKRQVSPLAFANAPRYHTGGIAGLRPNEMTAILEKGEEVLTEDDPRHRTNGGLAPSAPAAGGLRQILAIGDDEIAGAMAGAAGESVTITHIRRNIPTLKQMLNQ